MEPITHEALAAGAGALISILLSLLPLVPALKAKWEQAADDQKQAINVMALFVVTSIVAALSCWTELAFVECSQIGLYGLLRMFALAALGNAGTFVTTNKIFKALTRG